MRVAHLITNLAMGGAERFLLTLLPALKATGTVETQLYLLNTKSMFFAAPPELRVDVVGFNAPWRDLQAVRQAIRRLRVLLGRDRIDILHTHLWICDFLGALAVPGTRTKHISHTHNTLGWMTSSRLGFRLRRRTFAAALARAGTQFVSCSHAAESHLRCALRLPNFSGAVVPYCIEVERFPLVRGPDCPSSRFCVGMAGRHVRSKGHHVLIEAVSSLERSGTAVQAKIAGDGEERDAIAQYARAVLQETPFEMVGPVRDMGAFFQEIDVMVQPSLSEEGLPVTVLEAMCSGVPVIASEDAGLPEIIKDGVSGFLVPRGDAEALADRIDQLRRMEPDELRLLKENARATILAECAAAIVAEKVTSIYRAVLRDERIANQFPQPGGFGSPVWDSSAARHCAAAPPPQPLAGDSSSAA